MQRISFLTNWEKIDTTGRILPRAASQTDENGFTSGKSIRRKYLRHQTNSFIYVLVLWLKYINYWTYTDVIWATKCLSKGFGIMVCNYGSSHIEIIFASVCYFIKGYLRK